MLQKLLRAFLNIVRVHSFENVKIFGAFFTKISKRLITWSIIAIHACNLQMTAAVIT